MDLKAERLRLREEALKFKRDRFESWKRLMEDKGREKENRLKLKIQLQREKFEFKKEQFALMADKVRKPILPQMDADVKMDKQIMMESTRYGIEPHIGLNLSRFAGVRYVRYRRVIPMPDTLIHVPLSASISLCLNPCISAAKKDFHSTNFHYL